MSRRIGTKSDAMDKSGAMEKMDKTNYRNLRRGSLDRKAIQVRCGADVVLADFNNNDKSNVCTWRFGNLGSACKQVSTTGSEASPT